MTKLPRGKLKLLCFDLEAAKENDNRRRAVGTRKAVPTVRVFVDPREPRRVRNALRAFGAEINGKSRVVYSAPEWNRDDGAMNTLWIETKDEVILLDSVEDGLAALNGNLFAADMADAAAEQEADISTDEESE